MYSWKIILAGIELGSWVPITLERILADLDNHGGSVRDHHTYTVDSTLPITNLYPISDTATCTNSTI